MERFSAALTPFQLSDSDNDEYQGRAHPGNNRSRKARARSSSYAPPAKLKTYKEASNDSTMYSFWTSFTQLNLNDN
eukprot:g18774.t1